MEDKISTVPIHLKMTLTAREAAEYSNIGINKIDSMLRTPNCPLGFLSRGTFLGRGKVFDWGKQTGKKGKNAPCGRLKRFFVAGNIKPLPTSEIRS